MFTHDWVHQKDFSLRNVFREFGVDYFGFVSVVIRVNQDFTYPHGPTAISQSLNLINNKIERIRQ